jgi:hypothetical protein
MTKDLGANHDRKFFIPNKQHLVLKILDLYLFFLRVFVLSEECVKMSK